ncbi:hypothetical protein [Glaciecola petra]|uniref:DUF4886 domain-containing protein n=1 Tax=Glaciecola petra TaxID=3075602 RepID=A0ABU2ZVI5_9ALTE|nr:hypothetical protein [Aestuariibacter sp. P117]MDT0596620.1 hypothetical protein [Aestuariibacter sp. P117]
MNTKIFKTATHFFRFFALLGILSLSFTGFAQGSFASTLDSTNKTTVLPISLAINSNNNEKQKTKPHGRVLFIGNSFSFYNNGIHNHFSSLIRASGEWERGLNRVRLLTLSGAHVYEQLANIDAHLAVANARWQSIVIQGHSNEPVLESKRERFENAIELAIEKISAKNIEPIIFMTWGYKGQHDMAKALSDEYIKIAKKHKVKVVPVGLAFLEAEKSLPKIDLFVKDVLSVDTSARGKTLTYRNDIKHPSSAGTYLAACVFYASLYNKSPEGNIFIADLNKADALALQQLSWKIVNSFSI